MSANKYWLWVIAGLVLVSFTFSCFNFFRPSGGKVAFFNVDRVYNEFDMKKELEGKMRKMDEFQNFMIDSLKFQIRSLESKAIASPGDKKLENQLGMLYEQFRLTAKEFTERNEGMSSQYNKMVLAQIHEKAKEYRIKRGFSYFFGQSENTDLIFYDEALDVSDDFIKYMNESYSGGAIKP